MVNRRMRSNIETVTSAITFCALHRYTSSGWKEEWGNGDPNQNQNDNQDQNDNQNQMTIKNRAVKMTVQITLIWVGIVLTQPLL